MAFAKFWAQFGIDATNNNVSVQHSSQATPTALSLTLGDYYIDSPTAAEDLLAELKTQLDTEPSPAVYSCSISGAGYVTISVDTGTFSLTAWDAPLRDLLGFTGNLTGASSYTAGLRPGYCWYPSAEGRAQFTDRRYSKAQIAGRAADGQVYRLGTTERLEQRAWVHEFLSRANVLALPPASGNDNVDPFPEESPRTRDWSWQRLWDYLVQTGRPFRFYADRTGAVGSYEATYLLDEQAEQDRSERMFPDLDAYWRVPISVWRRISSAGTAT